MTVLHRLRWVAWLTALMLVTAASGAVATAEAEPEVVVASSTPQVESGKAGGSAVTVTFTNSSDEPVDLAATVPSKSEGCVPTLEPAKLPVHRITRVSVGIPASCGSASGLPIEVTPTPATGAVTPFVIEPHGPPSALPSWANLWAFPVAFGGALLGAVLLFLIWHYRKRTDDVERGLWTPLVGIDTAFSVSDNWGTNVVAVGTVLTALFSVTGLKPILGEDSEAMIALATVGSLIAAVPVAFAPLGLILLQRLGPPEPGKARQSHFTAAGILFAAMLVLTSAYGLLWVLWKTGVGLDLGGVQGYLFIPFLAIGIFFLFYAVRMANSTLERGVESTSVGGPAIAATGVDAAVDLPLHLNFAESGEPAPSRGPVFVVKMPSGMTRRPTSGLL